MPFYSLNAPVSLFFFFTDLLLTLSFIFFSFLRVWLLCALHHLV